MSFCDYLQSHYVAACELQRSDDLKIDTEIVAMLQHGPLAPDLVKRWMRNYGLFQGITNQQRSQIVKCFLEFASSRVRTLRVSDDKEIASLYSELFTALYRQVPRSWMSATSKLLWCLYPYDIVLYDAFVHRALVVMQCIDVDLSEFARIGTASALKSEADIARALDYYMSYQAMVRKLKSVYAHELDELRQRYNETYPYDIRILDKLLWMIGNPKWPV
jgi:hypothetical protein